jgi:hypothetical protein
VICAQSTAANQPFDIEFQIQRKDGVWICTLDVSQLAAVPVLAVDHNACVIAG